MRELTLKEIQNLLGYEVKIIADKQKTLGEIKLGSIVKIGNREYIVLGHSTETTAVITKNIVKNMEFGKSWDYSKSYVRDYCNGDFYKEIVEVVGKENVILHTVNLTCDDGSNKGITCKDNVSILTNENYRRYREYLPIPNKSYWVATGITTFDETFAHYACSVCSDGILRWNDCGYSHGVRPFCILNSSIFVS